MKNRLNPMYLAKNFVALVLLCCTLPAVSAGQNNGLTKAKALEAEREIVKQWKNSLRKRLWDVTAERVVRVDTLVMPIYWQTFGNKPADGRSLYISLHGGGNAPAAVNDGQWQNQWFLYQPDEGVYVCPRAPYNDWDLHFKPLLDRCYRELISYCVAYMDVNPDKVYIMGYSAGGDGVWRLAPRMADTWAAASMMAGHPGDVRLESLRNLPFSVWCGEFDSAYDRNRLAAQRLQQLDSLRTQDPQGYEFTGALVTGKGHWMDRVDTVAVTWMSRFVRNPYPKQVVWHQEENQGAEFYWLKVSPKDAKRHNEVRASYDGNTVTISKSDYNRLTVCLNDRMMNLDQPVRILYKGKVVYEGRVPRTKENIRRNLELRQDERYAFPAEVEVTLDK